MLSSPGRCTVTASSRLGRRAGDKVARASRLRVSGGVSPRDPFRLGGGTPPELAGAEFLTCCLDFRAAWNLLEPISSSGHPFPLTLPSPQRLSIAHIYSWPYIII